MESSLVLENQKTNKSRSRSPQCPGPGIWEWGSRHRTPARDAALPRRRPQASGSCIYGIISECWQRWPFSLSSQDRWCWEKGNMSFPKQGWREERLYNNRNFKEGKIHYSILKLKQIGDILFPHHPHPCHFIDKVLKSGMTDWSGKPYTVVSKPREAFFQRVSWRCRVHLTQWRPQKGPLQRRLLAWLSV